MRYNIAHRDELSRSEKRNRFIKWVILAFVLLFFYVIMRAGIFGSWQPMMIIPLAVAAAMFESELPSCIYALFCGFMIDIACNNVLGFSAVWLMAVCVAASLLVRNLIRVNLFNFCIIAAAMIFIEFSMDYLFNILLWNVPRGDVILTASIIPTALATLAVSPAVYYLVRFIESRLGRDNADITYYDDDSGEKGEDE